MVSGNFAKCHSRVIAALRDPGNKLGDPLSHKKNIEISRQVSVTLKLPCSVLNGAIFTDTLVPPLSSPEPKGNPDEAFGDLSDLICPALLQAPLLTALRVLLPALASMAKLHGHWIMDPCFYAKHKLDYLFKVTWEYLQPHQVSLAPYPVDIPPTPPSYIGNPDIPLVDSSSLPLTSAEIFSHLMAVDATDNSSPSGESCNQMPTPRPLEKGKMHTYDPVTPSPLPAPLEPPIELVSPAVTSVVPQGMSAGAPWGPPPGAVGQTGKTCKAKKGTSSFTDVTAKAAKKPGRAKLPCQQSKITQHFQPAATAKLAKPPPSPHKAQHSAKSYQSYVDLYAPITCRFCGSASTCQGNEP